MRNMSFALTTAQVCRKEKTVTRRLGWTFVSRAIACCGGEVVQPVLKAQGLKKGEQVQRVGGPIRIFSMRREPLRRMVDEPAYGRSECVKEGFPTLSPTEFVTMFCRHNNCTPDTEVTRLEFSYEQ